METKLAATAAARKDRLIALRKRKQAVESGENEGNTEADRHFKFKQRNFDPETRQLRKRGGGGGGEDDGGEDVDEDTVEKAVEGLAEAIIKEDEEKRKEELDLFNIAPRRANWDLKRDMTNRMAKLERKTNEAIATIFRQRLQAMRKEQNPNAQVDLVASLNAQREEREEEEGGGQGIDQDSEED